MVKLFTHIRAIQIWQDRALSVIPNTSLVSLDMAPREHTTSCAFPPYNSSLSFSLDYFPPVDTLAPGKLNFASYT